MGSDDTRLLMAAHKHGCTLVTRDQRTIPALLQEFAEAGLNHSGVIIVSRGNFEPHDVGGMIRGLRQLWDNEARLDWTNRVRYLERA